MKPVLRYMLSGAADGLRNMALDERLLEECRRGAIDGALRVYEWLPPAVSLGHGQPADLIDLTKCKEAGVDLVRRITGGGAVLHWEEVTYCLVVRRELMPALKWPRQFAALVATALCAALTSLGVEASPSAGISSRENGARSRNMLRGGVRALSQSTLWSQSHASRDGAENQDQNSVRPSLCFSSSTENEISVWGRKLAGCAHKFTKEVFFSHGSILTGPAHLRIVELLGPGECVAATYALKEKSTCLSDLLPLVPGAEVVGRELKKQVEESFGVSIQDVRVAAGANALGPAAGSVDLSRPAAGSGDASMSSVANTRSSK